MDVRAATTIGKNSGELITRFSCGLFPLHRKVQRSVAAHIHRKKVERRFAVKAASSGEYSGHRSIVDEDMLMLRKRMHEVRMEEINYIPPQHWMEWEKKWFPTYDSDVCASLQRLQDMLLHSRPAIAIGFLALISFTVPASVLLLLIQSSHNLNRMTTELLSAFH